MQTMKKTIEYQLIALTYSGGWYRLGLPTSASLPLVSSVRPSSAGATTGVGAGSSAASHAGTGTGGGGAPSRTRLGQYHHRVSSGSTVVSDRTAKERGKGKDGEEKVGRECVLLEYRRFGRWDGWG